MAEAKEAWLADDARGLQAASDQRRCFGLQGIRQWAKLLGGWARLRGVGGRGALLHFRFPWRTE